MNKPRIDHIGIIVENLDDTVKLFERLFDVKPVNIKEMPEVGLKIAHINAANISIELLQYTGSGDCFAKRVMGSETGVNHFSASVKDVDAAIEDFKNKGLKVMEGFPRPGSHGKVAFFDPGTTGGILMEICGE